ncbi:glucan 1,3-beta-glucosidase GLUC78 precursor [Eremomyces bilateralis CBS 781.70]|uniref:Glucan 1,3-beta-glucosidase GLUC78 n=1 Tax=Eremomyces bilateralis CBS 781.70 TaxID=1392243 RepID=A0A6G1FZZ9_9PEZI|nr:glucan 1,3-beta-glucosidase GLUC78 precursor [Eremomyces bilateralis CBS 781.70]KAF1811435.1 glucan 1,3-beta-glucosidase GLUC78 precursor [Eremomyces bilateralis CBS 781.70]
MVIFSLPALELLAAVLLGMRTILNPVAAHVPRQGTTYPGQSAAGPYWVSNIERKGTVAYGNADFKIFRNVKDYGARGDGVTDDTAAINQAISEGNRCGGGGCDSSTVTPAIVYFPAGTYIISQPLLQYYYTQMIGDATNLPVLKAAPQFEGMAVIDADPYLPDGVNWFTNQNNFFRQVRNFVIDLRAMPPNRGAGIHWQVAQATSLHNIRFEMVKGGADNRQQGIFMDNGSGGWMSDLIFNGGQYGAFLGNQQFTTRNLVFNDCDTAIFMNWNWAWTFKSVSINNCRVGVDMANGGFNQTVGSILMLDSKIQATDCGFNTSFSPDSIPNSGGTLILENTDFTGTPVAVKGPGDQTVVAGGAHVANWVQGRSYIGNDGMRTQTVVTEPAKSAGLLSGNKVFERSKPQYENVPASQFVSVKSAGAVGDGLTDDTAAIQQALTNLKDDQILYFDHGAYLITDTVFVGCHAKITGEIWPLIMASGPKFQDPAQLRPVFKVGNSGQSGAVEMSDLMFETRGPVPGAVLMEWNLNAEKQGSNGMWDVHFRIGGSAGTLLQSDTCAKKPSAPHGPDPKCVGAGMLYHTTKDASVYLENCWFWVSDHELDLADHYQIDIYNGRGVLIESQNPVWFYGTNSEHNVLYNYQVMNAKNVWMGLIQSETPYYQSNPSAPFPFTTPIPGDPTFGAPDALSNKAWGLRVVDSEDVFVYGAGLYSFFENYDQKCVPANNCQNGMISIEGTSKNIRLFGISTKAAVDMIVSSQGSVKDLDNRSNFCGTVARWVQS